MLRREPHVGTRGKAGQFTKEGHGRKRSCYFRPRFKQAAKAQIQAGESGANAALDRRHFQFTCGGCNFDRFLAEFQAYGEVELQVGPKQRADWQTMEIVTDRSPLIVVNKNGYGCTATMR